MKNQNMKEIVNLKELKLLIKTLLIEDIFLNLKLYKFSAKDKNNEEFGKKTYKIKFSFGVDYYGLKDFHFNVNGEYIGTR